MSRLTSTDIITNVNNSEEIVGIIKEHTLKVPEFGVFGALAIPKTTYNTMVRTALPSVAFRAINEGREHQKSTLTKRPVECACLDATFSVDFAATSGCDWGKEVLMAEEAAAHMLAAMLHIAKQVYYGTDNDAKGFPGVNSILANSDDAMVVDAGGSSVLAASSVYAFKFGLDACGFVWGKDGKIDEGDERSELVYDDDGLGFNAWVRPIQGYVGFQLSAYESIGRICNLTTESGKGLTDDLVGDLLSLFRVGARPDVLMCSRRSLAQLRQSRTPTTDREVPFPDDVFHVPIVATEAILDTEAILEESGS